MHISGYNLSILKPDGSHYVAVSFDLPYCLHLPNSNYSVRAQLGEWTVTSQIQLEARRRNVQHHQGLLVSAEKAEKFADPKGTYRYTSVIVYVPINRLTLNLPDTLDDVRRFMEKQPDQLLEQAVSILNRLISIYRFCTGECHIRPLSGSSVWLDFDLALLFNEYPATAAQSKFTGYVMPVYDFHDIVSEIPSVGSETLIDCQEKFASGYEVPLAEELLLNAYDFFYQGNNRLAVIEAETGFEAALFQFLKDHFRGKPIKTNYDSPISMINDKPFQIALNGMAKQFKRGEDHYKNWHKNVWEVRGGLVHGNVKDVPDEVAGKAIQIIEDTLGYLLQRPKTKPWHSVIRNP